ncbi:hypothetical protein ACHAWF_001383 [Thalassiosira exigua]
MTTMSNPNRSCLAQNLSSCTRDAQSLGLARFRLKLLSLPRRASTLRFHQLYTKSFYFSISPRRFLTYLVWSSRSRPSNVRSGRTMRVASRSPRARSSLRERSTLQSNTIIFFRFVEDETIVIKAIRSEQQIVDIFTKPLCEKKRFGI